MMKVSESMDTNGRGDIHVLIVKDVGDDEYDFADYEVIHKPECYRGRPFPEDLVYANETVCGVGFNLDQAGDLKWQLKYAGTPVTHPGVFKIESWFEVHQGGPWGPAEYDGGIGLVENDGS